MVPAKPTTYDRERELQREVADLVHAGAPDVEVLALELNGADRFCVYVDRPGGVDHDLCARVTRMLWAYLDRYAIQVSSPGLERPLRTRRHFDAHTGEQASVKTVADGGRKRTRGTIVRTRGDAVELETPAGVVAIPYDDIVRANLIDGGRVQ
jgi:ribosome maturation factor RimP